MITENIRISKNISEIRLNVTSVGGWFLSLAKFTVNIKVDFKNTSNFFFIENMYFFYKIVGYIFVEWSFDILLSKFLFHTQYLSIYSKEF